MRPDDLRELLRHQPFQPLRLHLTDGTVIDVKHPDTASVERSTVKVVLRPEYGKSREAVVALLPIVWIEVVVTTI